MDVIDPKFKTSVSFVHSLNWLSPDKICKFGIFRVVNAVLQNYEFAIDVVSEKSTLLRLVHPLNISFVGEVFALLKYPNSLNDVIVVLFLNIVPILALAASLIVIPIPSPTPAASNTLSTSGSSK
jgi:hypothetical protein